MVFLLAFPGASQLKAVLIVAFFFYMMAQKIANYRKTKNTVYIVGALLFLGYAYISRFWASHPEAVSEQIANVLWAVMICTAVSCYVYFSELSVRDISNLLVPIAILFCFNVVFNASFDEGRMSIGINANSFGRIASGMACVFLFRCKQDKWKNIFMNCLTIMFLLFTFLSGSRTSLLLVCVYAIAFMLFEHPTKSIKKTVGKLLLLLVLLVAGYVCLINIDFLYNSIGNRVESLLLEMFGLSEGDGSTITRINMMNTAREIFAEHPWVGIGMNNFKFATHFGTYAHNTYLELAACLGVVGLVLYYGPLVLYLKQAISGWRKDRDESIVPLAILIAFLLGDIGGVSYFNPVSHIFVGLAVGLISQNEREDK